MVVDWIYRLELHINDIFFISNGFRKNKKNWISLDTRTFLKLRVSIGKNKFEHDG